MSPTRTILTLSLLLLATSPALACLNDTQTSAAEAEFRSRYDSPPPTAPASTPTILGLNRWSSLATLLGVSISCYAIAATLKRKH